MFWVFEVLEGGGGRTELFEGVELGGGGGGGRFEGKGGGGGGGGKVAGMEEAAGLGCGGGGGGGVGMLLLAGAGLKLGGGGGRVLGANTLDVIRYIKTRRSDFIILMLEMLISQFINIK